MIRTARGALIEYGLSLPPLALVFELNPQSLSMTRTVTVKTGGTPGARGGYDFFLPGEAARASQGASAQPETLSMEILLDASDRMGAGDPVASLVGVQPEMDTLRLMAEPRAQGPVGQLLLSMAGGAAPRAFESADSAPVLLFVWGDRVLPVFLTSLHFEERAHLPSLIPYRVTANLTMQVIESQNPFYMLESARRLMGAASTATSAAADVLRRLF
jgi:hypothetical protein